jgi:acetyl-CoA synthetase
MVFPDSPAMFPCFKNKTHREAAMTDNTSASGDFCAARALLFKYREDRDAASLEFTWPRPLHFNWALDYFDPMAAGNSRLALWIVDDDGAEFKASFAEMRERSNRAANFLREHGVRRGDHILLMLGNVPPLWEIMLGAIKLGAVVIPSTTLLARKDLIDRIERGAVAHVVTADAETGKFDGLPGDYRRIVVGGDVSGWVNYGGADNAPAEFTADGESKAGDPLMVYFTSGTTAKPKLVLQTHASYPIGHLSTMYWLGLREGDIHLNISSPGWAKHSWSCFFAPWNAGATVFTHAFERFDAKATLDVIAARGVTSLCAPPTVWRLFVQQDLAAWKTSLTNLTGAGEPLNPEVIEAVEAAWGLTIRDGYGQTETTALIANAPGQAVKPGAMGKPLPGYRVALLDAEGREAGEGEICLALDPRPVGLMPCYLGNPEKTAAVMAGGYYRTGDIARRDDDGYLTFVGRADDVFKASDYRISPFELESVLIEHDAVAEAAVVPSPDPLRLAVPKGFIALAPGWQPTRETASAILTHAREHLAPFKRVRRLEFADLPKTISGKIRRVELRALEQERRGGDRYDPAGRYENEYWWDDFAKGD